jgi:hypothetical protein
LRDRMQNIISARIARRSPALPMAMPIMAPVLRAEELVSIIVVVEGADEVGVEEGGDVDVGAREVADVADGDGS